VFFHSVFSPDIQIHNLLICLLLNCLKFVLLNLKLQKSFKDIDPNKACGSDNIPGMLLIKTADEIAPSLCWLFYQSLSVGCVPIIWKHANILL
jgi:hypothetical protein